ncbi:hypothetical protein ACFFSY_08180 [Paenibacillus aurantiacus]|uniref:Tetratricopeptide repeat protein n=1 Tax=Paenibacillus aurantiacus TaxID=1936118 RepID=A0ABV5KL05_9BACL
MVEWGLAAYYLLALIYLLLSAKRGLRDFRYTVLLVAGLPVFGLPLAIIQDFAARGEAASDEERFRELMNARAASDRIFQRVNVGREVNLLPLEEALIVNETGTRRRLLLDVLKEDMDEKMIPLLEQAMSNEDTETSHYAVTAVMEIKRKLLLDIQKYSVRYEADKTHLPTQLAYAEAIQRYLNSGFMDKRTQTGYRMTYVRLLKELLRTEAASEALYADVVRAQMALGHYDEALRYAKRFLEQYETSEDAYLVLLDVYYTLQLKEPFEETLEALKASKISVSNKGLNVIRYWSAKGA